MQVSNGKTILLAVGIVAAAGIGYLTLSGGDTPTDGAEGTMGVSPHQAEKTRYYQELNERQEVETIAKIAAQFEKVPTEAEKMLNEQGWSRMEFDKMVEDIRADETKKEIFESAKRLALQ